MKPKQSKSDRIKDIIFRAIFLASMAPLQKLYYVAAGFGLSKSEVNRGLKELVKEGSIKLEREGILKLRKIYWRGERSERISREREWWDSLSDSEKDLELDRYKVDLQEMFVFKEGYNKHGTKAKKKNK